MNTTKTLIVVAGILTAMIAVNTGFGQVSKPEMKEEVAIAKVTKHQQKALKHEQKIQKLEVKPTVKSKYKAHPKEKMKIKPITKSKHKTEKLHKKVQKLDSID